ncbi:CcmD family protein [bacterium]|nr:CcmD family protein [bacterium]
MKAAYSALAFIALPLFTLAAKYEPVTWDKTFRESGKIFVVVAVVLLILLSVFGYLITQDRRISKIEKELKNK